MKFILCLRSIASRYIRIKMIININRDETNRVVTLAMCWLQLPILLILAKLAGFRILLSLTFIVDQWGVFFDIPFMFRQYWLFGLFLFDCIIMPTLKDIIESMQKTLRCSIWFEIMIICCTIATWNWVDFLAWALWLTHTKPNVVIYFASNQFFKFLSIEYLYN